MTKKYCLDTSGLSNPFQTMPPDIHITLWEKITKILASGKIAVTAEIYDELQHVQGIIYNCVVSSKSKLVLEIGDGAWNWEGYSNTVKLIVPKYKHVISEYQGGRKNTVGMNDISIICLAKTLNLPLVSMEAISVQPSSTKMRIPQVCNAENINHLTFNEFLRAEGIKI